jgi:hypothetical protein
MYLFPRVTYRKDKDRVIERCCEPKRGIETVTTIHLQFDDVHSEPPPIHRALNSRAPLLSTVLHEIATPSFLSDSNPDQFAVLTVDSLLDPRRRVPITA